ncbi:MAG TPA: class I SAM-dependent methyltransferase [Ramlibacter sp.]|nr:class I SAM-dependent methyltransferase [Ramlibacter sp.]
MPILERRRGPNRSAALAQYRRRARYYDQELALFEPIREQAIANLRLQPGATVLDVGCGTGLSFGLLERRLGSDGRIVGIEQCPEMMANARTRVQQAHWHNVDLVCAPAAVAPIATQADAALFHFVHDILREDAAIDNVLDHLKPGASVVATGLQWAPLWMWPANGFVMAAALYSVTALESLGRPWDKLRRRLHDVVLDTAMLGGIYVLSGRYEPAASRH